MEIARQMDLGSDLVETYNSIKCLGMVQASTKAGHLSLNLGRGRKLASRWEGGPVGLKLDK